jgi:hypothetical protein
MRTNYFIVILLFAATSLWGGCVDEDPTLWQPSAGPGEAASKRSAYQFGGGQVSESSSGPNVSIDFDASGDAAP